MSTEDRCEQRPSPVTLNVDTNRFPIGLNIVSPEPWQHPGGEQIDMVDARCDSTPVEEPGGPAVAVQLEDAIPDDVLNDLVLDMAFSDYLEELERLADVITNLRRALDETLTCTSAWCMCDAHQLLRDTETDEEPFR
jgi:hypothetical protein